MRVLVVGGTGFLGGAVTAAALSAGHEVSVFTRGKAENMSPGVSALVGDRNSDLSALRGKRFDLVIDTCAYTPRSVSLLLDALADDIGRYALVSSSSVYPDCSEPGVDEQGLAPSANAEQLALADAVQLDKQSDAASYGEAYGPLKRSAEEVAIALLGERALILRSGLLVGAGDYTDRMTWWVRRVDQGGPMVAPGDPERLIQFIDVRDAAGFIVAGSARGLGGIFNLTGIPLSWAQFLSRCQAVTGSDCEFRWISEADILAEGVAPWSELPMWLPARYKPLRHFLEIDTAKALRSGLKCRPIDETIGNLLDWDRTRRTIGLKAGLPTAKEEALLARQ